MQTGSEPRVAFFIPGVQKGGTTALDELLRQHPAIAMARGKEAHFFDKDTLDWDRPDYGPYHQRYPSADQGERLRGDATPIYLYWPRALERIAAYNPAARFIVCLRHPAHRAWSQWLMESVRGKEPLPFADAIREPGRRRLAGTANGAHPIFSYVERGLYGGQLERLLGLFPREAVSFVRTDSLWRDPSGVVQRLHGFLGLEPRPVQAQPRYVSIPPSGGGQPIAEAEQAYLTALFADEIRRTAALSGLDLADWLDPAYREPMAP